MGGYTHAIDRDYDPILEERRRRIREAREADVNPLETYLGTLGSEISDRTYDFTLPGILQRGAEMVPDVARSVGRGAASAFRAGGQAFLPESVQEQFGIAAPPTAPPAEPLPAIAQEARERSLPVRPSQEPGQSRGGAYRPRPRPESSPEWDMGMSVFERPTPEQTRGHLRYDPDGEGGPAEMQEWAPGSQPSRGGYVTADPDAMGIKQRIAMGLPPEGFDEVVRNRQQQILEESRRGATDPLWRERESARITGDEATRRFGQEQTLRRGSQQQIARELYEAEREVAEAEVELAAMVRSGEITEEEHDARLAAAQQFADSRKSALAAAHGLRLPSY
jgi:hypothetical protein